MELTEIAALTTAKAEYPVSLTLDDVRGFMDNTEANYYDSYKPHTNKNYLNYNAALFKFLSNIPPGARFTWIIYDETPIYSELMKEMQTHG